MLKSKREHNFIYVDNSIYINLKEGLLSLYFNLYSKAKPFSIFERKSEGSLINYLPTFIIRSIRVSQFIWKFYNKRRNHGFSESSRTFSTVHYGNYLLKLREREYKVFNLKRGIVTTVYPKPIPFSLIESRICNLRKTEKCVLAPKVIKWDVNKRYLVEEYINLYRPSYNFNNMKEFHYEVFPMLGYISSTSQPILSMYQRYTLNRIKYAESIMDKLQSSIKDNSSSVKVIRSFLSDLSLLFKGYSNQKILLVNSHGDFWEGNILINRNNSRVIDWNTFGKRSCYFDFFYIMFMLASKNKYFDEIDQNGLMRLSKELEHSFVIFYNQLKNESNFNSLNSIQSLGHSDMYRYLFYLELIVLKLQAVEVSSYLNQINEIRTWVRRFTLYEEICEE